MVEGKRQVKRVFQRLYLDEFLPNYVDSILDIGMERVLLRDNAARIIQRWEFFIWECLIRHLIGLYSQCMVESSCDGVWTIFF